MQTRFAPNVGLALALLVFAASARADDRTPDDAPAEAPASTTIGYRASGDRCPAAPQFLVEVGERSHGARVRLAASEERADYRVDVTDADAAAAPADPPVELGARGRIEVVGEATTVLKEVRGASCAEVASALALVLALALEAPPPAAAPPAAPAVVEPPPPPFVPPVADEPAPIAAEGWGAGVGLLGVVEGGVAPRVSFGGAASIEIERRFSPPWELLLRLSARAASSGEFREAWGSATITTALGVLQVCPIDLAILRGDESTGRAPRFGLASCVGGGLGARRARGHIASPSGRSNSDTSLDAEARVSFLPRVVLTRRLRLEGELGLRIAAERDQFVVTGPSSVVYLAPRAGGFASLGVVLRLP